MGRLYHPYCKETSSGHVCVCDPAIHMAGIVAIFEQCKAWLFFANDGGRLSPSLIDGPSFIEGQLEQPAISFYVFYEQAQTMGFVSCYETTHEGIIDLLAVGQNFRRHGLAQALLLFVINLFVMHGKSQAFVAMRSDNSAALALYEKSGFVIAEVGQNFVRLCKVLQ